ncbi:MAG: hypothetical protein AAB316_15490 [Bacteroidota bacterium]
MRKAARRKPLKPKKRFAPGHLHHLHKPTQKTAPKYHHSHKKSRPDIHVKKSSYSKAARQAVLTSATARQQLIELGGENTIDIIREFDSDMSDEELARKTGIKASDVRVVLNRLHSCGLFSYTRVRDRDSGWYSYIWKMSEGKLRNFINVNESAPVLGKEDFAASDDYLKNNIVQPAQMPSFERKRR